MLDFMAERVGFEPTIPLRGYRSVLGARSHARRTRTQTPFSPKREARRFAYEMRLTGSHCNSNANRRPPPPIGTEAPSGGRANIEIVDFGPIQKL